MIIKSAWRDNLIEIVNELNSLLVRSEKKRAAVDQDINFIVETTRENSEKAIAVSRRIHGGKGLNLELFKGLYQSISASVNQTFSGMISSLNELVDQIGQILTLKSTLEEVSHSIKNVSLLMKVKSSKLMESEFDHVVIGLEGLSSQIKENTEGINLSATEAKESIVGLIEKLKSRLNSFKRAYSLSQNNLKRLYESISSIFGEIKTRINSVKRVTEQIEGALTELTTSIPYQTMSYERVESVVQGLSELIGALENGEESTEEEMLDIQESIKAWKETIEEIGLTVREASARVGGMLEEIIEKVSDQIEVAQRIDNLVQEVDEKIKVVDMAFVDISNTLSLSPDQTETLLSSISDINKNVLEVSDQVSLIEVTRNDLEALTYNAVFKAVKVGAKGRVMGTITDEITGLSKEVHAKIADKESVINSIVDSSKEFKGTVSDGLNKQLEIIRETNQEVNAETGRFIGECDQILEVSTITDQLKVALKRARSGILIDESIEDGFVQARVRMQTIVDEISFELNEAKATQHV